MSYATIHLQLTPYPAPSTVETIDFACGVAKMFEAKLSVCSSRLSIRAPPNWFTGAMMSTMVRELEGVTTATTKMLESHLERAASSLGVTFQLSHVAEHWPAGLQDNAWRGRVSDLCVLSLAPDGTEPRLNIEDWIFGAGRPCLLLPESSTQTFSLENVLICWDFSRSAARTVSDALPLLHNAKHVRIAIFKGEKDIPVDDAQTPLLDFLSSHGVTSEADEVRIGDRTIGRAILEHASATNANLIMMGAFGHSRLQEFLLGGATKEVLDKSTIPLLMSH